MSADCPTERNLCALAELRFKALEEIIKLQNAIWDTKYDALRDEILKSERLLTIRLDEMNHIRKKLEERDINYATRRETIMLNFIISIIIVFIGALLTWALTR
jgi:hypothetical protein